MWRDIKYITDCSRKNAQCPPDPSLPDAFSSFYTRFEASNTTTTSRFTPSLVDPPLSMRAAEVRMTLQKINPRKAAGPNRVPSRVLKNCAHQLSMVMTVIFNISLSQATVPTCLKRSTIVPVPKAPAVSVTIDQSFSPR